MSRRGIKQANDITCLRVKPGQIRAFAQIALRAGQSKVFGTIAATMLARDDVLNVKAQFGELLRQTAVLAQIGSTRTDELP